MFNGKYVFNFVKYDYNYICEKNKRFYKRLLFKLKKKLK